MEEFIEQFAWFAKLHGYTMQDIVIVEVWLNIHNGHERVQILKRRRIRLIDALRKLEKKLLHLPETKGIEFKIILK